MQDRVMQVLSKAIEELNQQLLPDERITPSPETRLFGDGGALDSLSLIHLVVLTEDLAQREFGREVLLSPYLDSEEENPFATVQTLAALLSDELAR